MARTGLLLIVPVCVALGGEVALADAEEHRLGVTAAAALANSAAGGSDATVPMGTLDVRFGYGWKDSIELGGTLTLAGGAPVVFEDATMEIDGLQQPGDLHANAIMGIATVDLRLVAGLDLAHAFFRTHPYLSVGAGVLTRTLTNQRMIDPMPAIPGQDDLGSAPVDVDVSPVVRLSVGVERRTSAGFAIGVDAGVLYAGELFSSASVGVQLAWYWY